MVVALVVLYRCALVVFVTGTALVVFVTGTALVVTACALIVALGFRDGAAVFALVVVRACFTPLSFPRVCRFCWFRRSLPSPDQDSPR